MKIIQHFSHQHPLTFVYFDKANGVDHCRICREEREIYSYYYECKDCNFNIHKSCAKYPPELQHPSHPKHLLLLKPHSKEACANCCSTSMKLIYKCPHCHDFFLCAICAFDLLLTKKAKNHDHELTLIQKLSSFMCDHCLKEGNGMPYFCPTCLFMVHSECTFLPLTVRPSIMPTAIHDHPLTLMPALMISLTCNACGNKIKGRFYFCSTCSFVAHPDCASLPSFIKNIRHKHPLNLTYSLPTDQSKRRVCQLCAKTMDMNYWVYCCSSQDFFAHLHCATIEEERDEMFSLNSRGDQHDTKLGGDRTEIHTEIKHFSHEHDLKFNDRLGIDKKCDGCMRSILSSFYACAQCGFFLHKSCAELPRKLRHSLHRHPLKLLSREQKPFRCDACELPCNGFDYRCDECDFDLDVQCSLIPDILTHPSHKQHQLILAGSSEYKNCSFCGSYRRHKFSCVDCEFTMDFKCLTLPHTMNYEKHDHSFTLCYTLEDESSDYYCDICEEKRDPKSWFYYCADCSYPAHPECILEKYPYLKFGRIFKYDIHQHPLALVLDQKTFQFSKSSDIDNTIDLAYECAECNFIVSYRCL